MAGRRKRLRHGPPAADAGVTFVSGAAGEPCCCSGLSLLLGEIYSPAGLYCTEDAYAGDFFPPPHSFLICYPIKNVDL